MGTSLTAPSKYRGLLNRFGFKMALVGKYQLESQENFKEYLTKVGVGMIKRNAAAAMSPTQEISIDGDKVSIKNSLGPGSDFTIGVPFEMESPAGGEKITATGSFEGDVLITKATLKGEAHDTTRERKGDKLVMTIKFGD